MIIGGWPQPRWRALEYLERTNPRRDFRYKLEGTCTGTDDRNTLARQID